MFGMKLEFTSCEEGNRCWYNEEEADIEEVKMLSCFGVEAPGDLVDDNQRIALTPMSSLSAPPVKGIK